MSAEDQEDSSKVTDTQKLISLMKEQNKEIKKKQKILDKLEEKFVKVNTDLKNILNDKTNIEAFLKNVFPKEMHNKVIKEDYGSYETTELSKQWLILESKNQTEFQNILSKLKNDITELTDKNKKLSEDYENVISSYEKYKNEQKDSIEQLNFYMSGYEEYKKQAENLENEKKYLMKMLDEKNQEIEVLNSLELENAELKAKSLLDNFDIIEPKKKNSFDDSLIIKDEKKNDKDKEINNNINNNQNQLKITSLNISVQTDIQIYFKEQYDKMQGELESYKEKYEKIKQDFADYKEKSHKIFLTNESNYNKILTEHENLKRELSQLLNKHNEQANKSKINQLNVHPNNFQAPSVRLERNMERFDASQRVNLEYLKNVLLKYLEAIAIGNEFQTKILENVIFMFLHVNNKEKKILEEKRITSSFYYNLWFNAKAFLTAKIYGEPQEESKDEGDTEKKNKDSETQIKEENK